MLRLCLALLLATPASAHAQAPREDATARTTASARIVSGARIRHAASGPDTIRARGERALQVSRATRITSDPRDTGGGGPRRVAYIDFY